MVEDENDPALQWSVPRSLWSRISTMKDLPLNALRAFALVYAHGGVRAAARELGIAHSSVSRHLGELDHWLGVPLLRAEAGRGAAVFTPQGEALGRAMLAGLGEIAQAVAALRESRPAHAVTLSTSPSLAIRWLLPRLPALEKAHPKLELSVQVEQRLDPMDDGRIDLAIRMGQGPWPALHAEPLMDDALYPVMSPALWLASGRPSKPAQLAGLRLLHDRDPQAAWESWRKVHGPARLALQGGARYTSSDLVLRAAMQGQGVALARHRLAADDVAAGSLLRPFGERDVPLGPSYWIVRPRAKPRAAVAAVIDWLHWQAAGARRAAR
jgi:LysR family glycine cleavage system transcriptional activator